MGLYPKSRFMLNLVFSLILLVIPYNLNADTRPPITVPNKGPMNKIISITTEDSKYGTTVNVLGDSKIYDYSTKTLDSPPRIVVDIPNAVESFESMTIPVKSPNLKSIRVGYHAKRIRLVLDIKGTDIPVFTTAPADNGLNIFLRSGRPIDKEEKGESDKIRQKPADKKFKGLEELIRIEEDDGQDDTASFLKGVNAYRAQNWSGAIEDLNDLIKAYPSGRYTERAYFLLARSYEQLYSEAVKANFTWIKMHYEDAINRFPKSMYVPGALLSIGNLCLKVENYYEALAYYNLIVKKYEDSVEAVRALMQKVNLFILKKKSAQALSILEHVISKYPGSPEATKAKIQMSKLLYEMNNFRRSINILSEVREIHSETIYQHPEVFLYLGHNYYELGDNVKARENLFRFYNSYPDKEMNDLILTKIADTYLNEGSIEDAIKFYQLVIERHPKTEGALISLIRLAEQQEEGELEVERGVALSVKVIGKEIGLPREIYEDVMNNILDKDEKNPLAQLALLKLAILYQREQDYDKSLKALKEFLNKYPVSKLRKEIKRVLNRTLGAMLKEDMKEHRYTSIINTYQREKDLFSVSNSPDPFLTIARASIHLNLHDVATNMFKRADSLLPRGEKPADLLFYVGRDLFKKDKLVEAISRLDLLLNKYPSDKNAPDAYRLKGKVLFKQKKYLPALRMFSSALRYPLKGCDRARILIDKVRALIKSNYNEKALKATGEADQLKRKCFLEYPHIYKEIGELYLKLGYPKKALSMFDKALEIEKEKENKILIKLKIAQCYRLLNKKKDYLDLYNQISGLNDPFWSNLAKERIEELDFSRQIRERQQEEERR